MVFRNLIMKIKKEYNAFGSYDIFFVLEKRGFLMNKSIRPAVFKLWSAVPKGSRVRFQGVLEGVTFNVLFFLYLEFKNSLAKEIQGKGKIIINVI